MRKILVQALVASMGLAFAAGCSGWDKDPTRGYESLNTSVKPTKLTENKQNGMNAFYFITASDNLVFVQGENHRVVFTTQLAHTDIPGVRYHLEMTEGPSAELGATFKPAGDNAWALEWAPNTRILGPLENRPKEFRLVLKFVLESSSSAQAKKAFANHVEETAYTLYLLKDFTQPFIEDVITAEPNATPGPTDTTKVQFIVAAAGVSEPKDLIVRLNSGPRDLGLEIAQLDGIEGVRGMLPKFVSKLDKDASGRERFLYEVTFKSKSFLDYALEEINKLPLVDAGHRPTLKSRLKNKQISEIEAMFSVEAVNAYNHMFSGEKNIKLNVQLPVTPAPREVPR